MANSRKHRDGGTVHKNTPADYVFYVINYAVFMLFALLCFFPFYYLFINTVSDNGEVFRGAITIYPKGIHFGNYTALQYVANLGRSVWITVSSTVISTAIMVFASAFAGYIFTKKNMWHRRLWYRFTIIPMYFNAGLLPWFLNMHSLGLTNNYLAYILPNIVVPFNIIMVKTYIESIPADIEESAVIDGAGTLKIFMKIMLPLSIPILATITIFGAVNRWNAFNDSLILMTTSPKLFTLQHRLYIYLTQSNNLEQLMRSGIKSNVQNLNQKVVQYTVSVVSTLPIVLVYPFMQRFFIKGIMMGAVKG
ncbi:MAG: carbohydrate ABC transporter permease [Clostridia bacterium]|nr:carbohydrate ABC transporter permease [Clostridia bacterium]